MIYYYKNNRRYSRNSYSVIGLTYGTAIYSGSTGRCIGYVGQNANDIFDKNNICIRC